MRLKFTSDIRDLQKVKKLWHQATSYFSYKSKRRVRSIFHCSMYEKLITLYY